MSSRIKIRLQRRNKKGLSKKLRGGVNSTTSTLSTPFASLELNNSQGTMNLSELDSSQGTMNLSELNITDSSDMGNTTLNTNDLSIDNNLLNITTITPEETNELYMSVDTDLSSISGNTTSEDVSMTFGGNKNRKTNKIRKGRRTRRTRKTRRTRRTRKTRKTRRIKRQRGGQGFTTSETTNPISYKEDEYDQFKNALNYKTN
jgi:hypothetical protein